MDTARADILAAAEATPKGPGQELAPPYASLIDALPDPLLVIAADEPDDLTGRRYILANAAAREVLHIPQDVGLLVTAIRDPDVLAALKAEGFAAVPTPHSPIGIRIPPGEGSTALAGSPLFLSGAFEFQDEAAQIASLLAGARPGMRVLDLAAGAGGKALAMAAAMNNDGHVLAFDDATGYLVGEEGRGLAYMFLMMNEARIGVGAGAVALGYTGYLHALAYAREREQGRPLADKDPAAPPVAIVKHPDVRRMLLASKSYVEGGLALILYAAKLLDEPSEGLSPKIVEQMVDAILAMKKEGVSIVVSEQNLHFARLISDRAYIIERGRICFGGTMAELDARPDIRDAHLSL